MGDQYFSDREQGPRPRIGELIDLTAWGGLAVLVQRLINSHWFAQDYSEDCPDGRGVAGTDKNSLALSLRAELPLLGQPDEATWNWSLDSGALPPTPAILDLIEFSYRTVAKPRPVDHHDFFGHDHLAFDSAGGKADFRANVNRILARNGLAFELDARGLVIRLAPPVLRETLGTTEFRTGDAHLDSMLEAARTKYLSPDPTVRREGLEKLWDAWERLKTVLVAGDKKASAKALLDRAATEPAMRSRLESEAKELTEIGNSFMIRHTETGKTPIGSSEQVDYLFHRLFALIRLLIVRL